MITLPPLPSNANFVVRLANRDDISALARISADAFLEDRHYDFRQPRRREYYLTWYSRFVWEFRNLIVSREARTYIAAERKTLTPVAMAIWMTTGDTGLSRQWKAEYGLASAIWSEFEGKLLQVERLYQRSRLIDYLSDHVVVSRLDSERKNVFAGLENTLCLAGLAVAPGWQGKGLGKMMFEWGIQLATQLSLPIIINSSLDGFRLYSKYGAKVVFWQTVGLDEGDSLRVPSVVWEPENLKGRWLEEDEKGGWRIKKERSNNSI